MYVSVRVYNAIIFGALAIGQATQYAPDYGKAKQATARIFHLWDTQPTTDAYSTEGATPVRINLLLLYFNNFK